MGHDYNYPNPGNGAMADFVARCFDPPREWLDMGKPSDALIEMLAAPAAYGVDLGNALMVGAFFSLVVAAY